MQQYPFLAEGRDEDMTPGNRALAIHDIVRFRTAVVEAGTLGRVVEVDDRAVTQFTIQFELPSLNGATITVSHLTELDVRQI
jgi:hypothetical protein